MEDLKEVLQSAVYAIIVGTVPLLATYLIKVAKVKIAELTDKIDNAYVEAQLNRISEIALGAVSATTQTYVDEIKKNGEFDKEAQSIAFNKSKDTIISLLNDEAIELINDVYGDLNTYLQTKIEESVSLLK